MLLQCSTLLAFISSVRAGLCIQFTYGLGSLSTVPKNVL
uniref:Uncharacterized protein n=1 Tax=Anguilla anguilla TaxID=7936 RepID=A0A0E9Y2A5_ANGAN